MKKRILTAAAILVLPLAFIGCSDGDSDSSVPGDVKTVVDAYTQSWNDYDGEAFLVVVTDDYRMVNERSELDATEQAEVIVGGSSFNTSIEQGDLIGTGDGPYYVATVNVITGDGLPEGGFDGISTLTVVDDGGTLKVSEHIFVGDLP